jgi:MacB-like periplasmic core domain
MGDWIADVRFAVRGLTRAWGYTTAAVLTLALGVGANVAVFSVLRAVLLEPLPFPHPERLVTVEELNPGWSTTLASSHAFLEWRHRSRSFERMAAAVWWDANLESGPEPMRVQEVSVSAGFFETLGVAPLLGRVFHAGEVGRGGAPLVILSHPLWQRLGGTRRSSARPSASTVRPRPLSASCRHFPTRARSSVGATSGPRGWSMRPQRGQSRAGGEGFASSDGFAAASTNARQTLTSRESSGNSLGSDLRSTKATRRAHADFPTMR